MPTKKGRKQTPHTPLGQEAPWQQGFLDAIAKHGNVGTACAIAKITRQTVYFRRKNSSEFEQAWEDALASYRDSIREEIRRRAIDGYLEPVFHNGKKIASIRKKSDTLLIVEAKRVDPEYRERYRHEHGGLDGKPIQTESVVKFDLSQLSAAELEALESIHRKIAVTGGDTGGEGEAEP